MVYKNFITRAIFSSIFIFFYFISLINIYYLFIFGCLIYLIIYFEIYKHFNSYIIVILLYVFISLLSFIFYLYFYFNLYYFNLLVYIIIFFDTFSYLTGNFIGKNYPFKKISPNKTLEGYLGGFIFTNLFYFLFHLYLDINIEIRLIILLNVIILSSIFGDLIQSYFKRLNKLKDSSEFLPGHGGFFDRFDSFIFSIIVLFMFNFLNL